MMHDWSWGFGMGWGYGGIILFIIVIAAIIVGLVFLIRWIISRSEGSSSGGRDAVEILKDRYARGDITREEYLEKKSDIEKRGD